MVKCAIFSVAHHSKNWHNLGTLLEKKGKCAKNFLGIAILGQNCANKNPAFSTGCQKAIFRIFILLFWTKNVIIMVWKREDNLLNLGNKIPFQPIIKCG